MTYENDLHEMYKLACAELKAAEKALNDIDCEESNFDARQEAVEVFIEKTRAMLAAAREARIY